MKIGYVIGELGRGGAELQLLRLASGLTQRGHEVKAIAYDGPSVLDDEFRAADVELTAEPAATRLQKLRSVHAWLWGSNFDIIHGIMRRASSLALLARLPRSRPPIVASDFSSATYTRRSVILFAAFAVFGLADKVVTEVEINRRSLERLAPWLRTKTLVVRNGLDTERFTPRKFSGSPADGSFVFCAVSTLSRVKNPLRVVDAVAELRRRGRTRFRVDWYGRDSLSPGSNLGAEARLRAAEADLHEHIVFHGDVSQIEEAYGRSSALLHASIQEGFPNAVAEGMACGLPIVVSRVSDLPSVVAEARNGFVFDETDPHSIADAMERLMDLPNAERVAMGERSRDLAVRWFGMERFLDEFEGLYRQLVAGGR